MDLFFVLSGYLITGILLDAKDQPGYFRNFYARRVLRIFPLYYGALLAVFVVVPAFCQLDSAARELSSRQSWLWCYLANFPGRPPLDNSDVFRLGHFWSLAVEEHFYVVWPLLVAVLSTKHLRRLCVSWMALALVIRLAAAVGCLGPFDLLKWSTISRADGLSCGALLASLVRDGALADRLRSWSRIGVWTFGLPFVFLSFIPRAVAGDLVRSVQISISVGFFASVLMLSAWADGGIVSRLMSTRWLVTFGKYSYGLYVIHGLLRPALERWLPPDYLARVAPIPILGLAAYMAFAIGVSFILAFLSWHLYEKQFLKLKRCFPYGSEGAIPRGDLPAAAKSGDFAVALVSEPIVGD